MNTKQLKRLASGVAAASLLVAALAVPASAATTSKTILIGSSGVTGVNDPGPFATGNARLTFTPVTAGNLTFFDVVVKNAGGQNINNVTLSVGVDLDPRSESVRPVSPDLTPTLPSALPATTSVESYTGAGCAPAAPTAGPIGCAVGTLRKGASYRLQIVLRTSVAETIKLKAVTKVSETSNDNGSNQDTFAAEGSLVVGAYSCEAQSAYLPGNSGPKTIGTCDIGATGNTNKQQFKVSFPARITTVSVSETSEALCPVTSGCFGATFNADLTGDNSTDLVTWTITVDLAQVARTNLNLNKLVIYHYNDLGVLSPAGGIANTNKNRCKNSTAGNCIVSASISGTILTVEYRSLGNGKTRLLG